MVRRSAAVLIPLGLLAAAQAYVLLAPALPVWSSVDVSIFVACSCGLLAVVACTWVAAEISDERALLVLVAAGSLVLVALLNIAGVGAAATPIEALAYASVGGLFALALLAPSLALALPVFVALVDVVSTLAGGLSEVLANAGQTHPGDPLSLELPDWGTGLPAGRLGISDAVFAGVFLVFARRFGFRPVATAVGLWVAMVVAVGLKVWLDRAIPVMPLMAIAYFAVNIDRVPALLARASEG